MFIFKLWHDARMIIGINVTEGYEVKQSIGRKTLKKYGCEDDVAVTVSHFILLILID